MPDNRQKSDSQAANQSAAARVGGLSQTRSKLDDAALTGTFNGAAALPKEKKAEKPLMELKPTLPAPAPGGGVPQVSPQLRGQAPTKEAREAFKAKMIRREFNEKARDVNRDR